MFRVFGYAIGYVFFFCSVEWFFFCTFSCEYCEIKHTGHSCLKQQSRRVPGRRREIQANEKVGCNVFFYVTDRGRSPVQSQHFLTLPKAAHNIPPVTARCQDARAHTLTHTHTRARAVSLRTASARAADFLHNVGRSENGRTRNSRLEQLL